MTTEAVRPDPFRWCLVHDAQEWTPDTPSCWKANWLAAEDPEWRNPGCDLKEIEIEPILEMDRIDAGEPLPEGWHVIIDTDEFQMIAKTVTYRRVIPALEHELEAMRAASVKP